MWVPARRSVHVPDAGIRACGQGASMSPVRLQMHDAVAVVMLDDRARRNVMGSAMVDALVAAFAELQAGEARVAVLRAPPGAGIWSAGHDVRELPRGDRDPEGWADPMRRAVRAVTDCAVPVIALVEGGVWGGAIVWGHNSSARRRQSPVAPRSVRIWWTFPTMRARNARSRSSSLAK